MNLANLVSAASWLAVKSGWLGWLRRADPQVPAARRARSAAAPSASVTDGRGFGERHHESYESNEFEEMDGAEIG